MNEFGFVLSDAQQGIFTSFMYGVGFGFLFGFLRYVFFRVVEVKTP